jgi:hypothetical protein
MLVTLDPAVVGPAPAIPRAVPVPQEPARPGRRLECADPDDEEEDLGDEEDLSVAQPLSDEESDFDDFDDEFDDDFEEEENDPDWDHPDETDSDELPPGKGPGRKK